jgi:hypothetical protein
VTILVTFIVALTKHLTKQLREEKCYFGSQLQRVQFVVSWPYELGRRIMAVA